MEKKRVGIIGGGIVGTALGYYLSLHPNIEVSLFEKDSIGSGTTAKSAGTVCLFDDSIAHDFGKCASSVFRPMNNWKKPGSCASR